MTHLTPHLRSYCPDADATAAPLPSSWSISPVAEPFDIEDFTAASDWERFVAGLEEILREWGLVGSGAETSLPDPRESDRSGWVWKQQRRQIDFHDFGFWVTRHALVDPKSASQEKGTKEDQHRRKSLADRPSVSQEEDHDDDHLQLPPPLKDMMSDDRDFPGMAHPVHYFFGFCDFVCLTPRGREEVDNQTRAKVALGTATVAANNTHCPVPLLVQTMDRGRAQFCGVFALAGLRAELETAVLLSKPPPDCLHLQDLLRVFREKLRLPFHSGSDVMGNFTATVRKSYLLEDWTSHEWAQAPPDVELFAVLDEGFSDLPLGATADPVKRMLLHATWKNVSEALAFENDVHSDFNDPRDAPIWSVGITFETNPICLLGEYLRDFIAVCQHRETMRQVLGECYSSSSEGLDKVPSALNRLTGPSYGIADILRSGQEHEQSNGPIKREYLSKMLEYLFPDSNPDSKYAYPEELKNFTESDNEMVNQFRIQLSNIKSCPVDGLLWRLTIMLAHCLHILGGVKPVAHLFHEFLLEVRYRWETGYLLPGLPMGDPDHSYCLLHQKLQMINCCIGKRRAREGAKDLQRSPHEKDEAMDVSEGNSETEEEEFFDCDDDREEDTPPKKKDLPLWDRNPEGRYKKFNNLRLLEHDAPLYVPLCQDSAPMTEDQLAEQAEMLMQLGPDAEGSEVRARMQSASLLSDMESFKAANPGSVLGDFVRWYSPRDWVEEGSQKGKLSARMELPGNPWQEAWSNAMPVPARRQKRLFDDTREADKVLQFLSSLRPGETALSLLPTLMHAAVRRVLMEPPDFSPRMVQDILSEALPHLVEMSRVLDRPPTSTAFTKGLHMADDISRRLQLCEARISQALSLRSKFLKDSHAREVLKSTRDEDKSVVEGHMEQFVRDLYSQPEVVVLGASRGPTGQLIRQMFLEAQRMKHQVTEDSHKESLSIFPSTCSSEYIVRGETRRPFSYSRSCPQRLYCCIKDREFRLAGAFTMDKHLM